MKTVFITSTLHSDWNIKFNPLLCKALEGKGISCYLPQRDTDQKSGDEKKFLQNIDGIKNSRIVLVIAANETPNLGAETGFAFGTKKKVLILTEKSHNIPAMIAGMADGILKVQNLEDIDSYIGKLSSLIRK